MSCSAYGRRHLEKQQVSLLSERCLEPAAAAEFSMAAGCQSAQHKNLLL